MSGNYDGSGERVSNLLSEEVSEVYSHIDGRDGVSREELYSSLDYCPEQVDTALDYLLEENKVIDLTRSEPEKEFYTVFKTLENL
jgi:hypothetical protein